MNGVVITGVGAVTCQGNGVAALLHAMNAAVAATPVAIPDPAANMRLPLIHRVDGAGGDEPGRAARLAVVAAREAIAAAGLAAPMPRAAVVMGSCMGEAGQRDHGASFVVASAVGRLLGAPAVNVSVSNACAAGGFALGMAADLIRAGEADVVIAGGADAYSRVGWACMDRIGAIDPVRCRPFDRNRRGTVLGEGAGVLVLESAVTAGARGATVYARVGESGWSSDAGHLTAPAEEGAMIQRAMRTALGDDGAGLACVIPHGTGTILNDRVESTALRKVLGKASNRTPLYSLKTLIGHTGGASAALGAVAAALILKHRRVPANAPLEQDPECEVFLPQEGPSPLRGNRVLVNAYAFGGSNSSFVLDRAI
jgi:3-oxoacyl-[acyl-carrier-protein] synthase II